MATHELLVMQQAAEGVEVLVERARAGDREAFAALYRSTVRPVYRYLMVRVNDPPVAEELTQEVFLAALRGIRGLRTKDEAGLLAWLLQIARNKLADHLRGRYRRPTDRLEQAEAPAAADPGPDELAEGNEERAALRRALEDLKPEQREVLVCKYVLGFDNQRTALLLKRSANAVNQLHHRALANLRRLLVKGADLR